MSRHRLAIAWIACFAVLFNMLAMPMSNAMAQSAKSPAEQLLWGSFCTSSGTKMVAISWVISGRKRRKATIIPTCSIAGVARAQHPVVALPGHEPQLYFAQFESNRSLPAATLDTPSPRQQWPSLNPRASPLV